MKNIAISENLLILLLFIIFMEKHVTHLVVTIVLSIVKIWQVL